MWRRAPREVREGKASSTKQSGEENQKWAMSEKTLCCCKGRSQQVEANGKEQDRRLGLWGLTSPPRAGGKAICITTLKSEGGRLPAAERAKGSVSWGQGLLSGPESICLGLPKLLMAPTTGCLLAPC